jgi:hypothetical protein
MRKGKLLDPIVDVYNVANYEWLYPARLCKIRILHTFILPVLQERRKEIETFGAQGEAKRNNESRFICPVSFHCSI